MYWLILIVSGLMEVGCIVSLKYANGFTRIQPLIAYTLFGFASAFLFSSSVKIIPLGLAFLIWVGVATIGITIYQYIVLNKIYSLIELIFMLLIMVGIVGLKLLQSK